MTKGEWFGFFFVGIPLMLAFWGFVVVAIILPTLASIKEFIDWWRQ